MENLTAVYIPEDMIIIILSRLPGRSLFRFRTVCKSWFSIISNPSFVDLHFRHANNSVLVHTIKNNNNSFSPYSSIDFPYFEGEISPMRKLYIVGSCNGIVCVLVTYGSTANDGNPQFFFSPPPADSDLNIYLWNPATKQSKLLPSLNPDNASSAFVSVGFGFDPIANDFKVVRTSKYPDGTVCGMVYSANMNVWKTIEPWPTISPRFSVCDVCVNGVLYWRWLDGAISYDLNGEVFYNHSFPANVQSHVQELRGLEYNFRHYRVAEMSGSIALIMYSYEKVGFTSKVNCWTMDDGIEGSWTLKFSFDVDLVVRWVPSYLNSSSAILYKTEDGVWWLYNSDKKTTENVPVPVGTSKMFKHTETLLPIRESERFDEMLMKFQIKEYQEQHFLHLQS